MSRVWFVVRNTLVLASIGLSLLFIPSSGVKAISLPTHCADLLDGDCDRPWDCFVMCFMELTGLDDFCAQNPTAPQCQ